jgi:predicted ferric reductase
MSVTAERSTDAQRRTPAPPWAASRFLISRSVALGLIALGGLGVLGLWWQDTTFVYGLGSWLTNAGRITGLLCGYTVVVLLALMARVPALEHGIGADRLARWHAMGGRYTVSLAVAHTLLIIWGYAVTAHASLVGETSTLVLTYPDVLMATVALGLLITVGAVSARVARRRLRYETWHFIHLYTYLAVALAFSHQFATGADFTDPTVRWLWATMYVTVGALLLWYRFAVPIRGLRRHVLRVVSVVPEGPGVASIYIGGRNLDQLRAESGQFFRWRFLTRQLWFAANPYSLSAAPRGDLLRITVKTAGSHSQALSGLQPGTRVLAEGPYGAFTASRRAYRRVLLIGAGVGITPLRALFESIPAYPGELTMLYRARTPHDLVLRGELDHIAAARGATVHYLLGPRRSRDGGGIDPLSRDRLERLIPNLRDHDVYLCGPTDLAERLRKSLRAAGVPASRIHYESFTF